MSDYTLKKRASRLTTHGAAPEEDRMSTSAWTFDDIPDQTGRTAIVTGANTGIGLETARMLAQKGAHVVLACRNLDKGQAALERVLAARPGGRATLAMLDLSDLDSVAAFAAAFARSEARLDLLVNNAGVMVPPLGRTKQGFELQFGTNHLGHFALAAHLLPLVQRTAGGRIVVVSSTAQNFGRIDFDDLNWERRPYRAWAAYGQSKLANQLFALELHRRLASAGSAVRVTSAHPGWTATDLQRSSGGMRVLNPLFAMKPADGALPTLRAATDPAAASGSYWGPRGLFELNGKPAPARISDRARDPVVAARLWDESERLTSVAFGLPSPSERGAEVFPVGLLGLPEREP
jgi:NAD(P)-dependent dehydrogenase (short-subunit alcohol dehydrogenase family)